MNRLAALASVALLLPLAPANAETPRTIIVMDGSGSMWGQIDGRAKLEIARETVAEVLGTMPAAQELGLMAYGHRRKGDCSDIELVVPPGPGTGPAILQSVNTMRFLGKTPLSQSVKQAAEALRYGEEAATVVLVTDGLETCEADPCALGRELEAAGLNFTAHVIGFGLTQAEGAQVACLATETGGRYIQASDAGSLSTALRETIVAAAPEPEPVPEPEPAVLPEATLDAPDRAEKGSEIVVGWTGPDGPQDTIQVALPGEGAGISFTYTSSGNPANLRLPAAVGSYELRYKLGDRVVLATRPIEIVEAMVSLDAPDVVEVGADVSILWQGPDAPQDNIQIGTLDGYYTTYGYVSGANPLVLTAPEEPGDYELRYKFRDQEVILTRPLKVVPVGEGPLDQGAAPMGAEFVPVAFDVPPGLEGAALEWSAVPIEGTTFAVEVMAMPEAQTGGWQGRLEPGDWDVTAEGPGVRLFARVQVVPEDENRFVIPVVAQSSADEASFESEGMGEDPPTGAPGDPVPIAISGVYGFGVTWRAIPLSGQDSDVLGDVAALGAAWNTRLDPGLWRIVGQAEGAIGAVYAGDIQVLASGETTIVMPHFMVNPDFPSEGGYRCKGKPICGMTDLATGLGMILPDGYGTDMPLFAQTAAGVRAAAPMVSMLDITGTTDEVIAVLNPLQWLQSNGTCTETEAGSFCTFAGLTAAQADGARAIGASIMTGTPRDTPQTLRDTGILVTNPPENLFDLLAPDWKRN